MQLVLVEPTTKIADNSGVRNLLASFLLETGHS